MFPLAPSNVIADADALRLADSICAMAKSSFEIVCFMVLGVDCESPDLDLFVIAVTCSGAAAKGLPGLSMTSFSLKPEMGD
mmetsp:Transcript_78972/g.164039  ORF Transcript_78972/g.164039 Transcript_78972/m.164039 type:complete len:81 (+) Transcript_78972:1371-1613(+)